MLFCPLNYLLCFLFKYERNIPSNTVPTCLSCWSSCACVFLLLYIPAAVCSRSCFCCVNHCSRFFLIWLLAEKGFLNPWTVQSCTHVHAIQPGVCGFLHGHPCLVIVLYIKIHDSLFEATGKYWRNSTAFASSNSCSLWFRLTLILNESLIYNSLCNNLWFNLVWGLCLCLSGEYISGLQVNMPNRWSAWKIQIY